MTDSSHIFLKRARLQGFQTVNDVTVDFLPGLNIIIGKNSTGKTNFVEFLEKALRLNYKGIYNFKTELLYNYPEGDVLLSGTRKINIAEEESKAREIGGNDGVIYTLDIGGEKKEYNHIGNLINSSPVGFGGILIRHGFPNNVPVLCFPWNVMLFPVDTLFEFGNAIEYPRFFRSAIMALRSSINYKSQNNNISADSIKESVKEAFGLGVDQLNNYLSGNELVSGVRLSNPEITYDSYMNKYHLTNLSFQFRSNGSWLPFTALSDGAKRIIYILMEFLWLPLRIDVSTGEVSQYNDAKSIIYLLEEPELGIHPHQLNQLMDFLKEQSEEKQIVVTTHSPQILDILSPEELDRIIICEYDKEKGTQLRHMTEIEKSDARNYTEKMFLSDFWRYTDFNDK